MIDNTTDPDSTRGLSTGELHDGGHAREDPRRGFDPKRGWLRRLERTVSNALASKVFPLVPGLAHVYDQQLRRALTLSQIDVELESLPATFDGFRLLFISDIHAGSFISPSTLEFTFQRLLATCPDVILLGGDLVTSSLREFVQHREAFAMLHAPMGVFAVLGNHDHYTKDPGRLRDMVEAAGIEMLHNRSVTLRRGDAEISLAGVDDLMSGRPDLEAALAETRAPVLLIAHNPDTAFDAARAGVALTLSGHTHGGQIRIPGLPVLVRQSRFRLDEGRYQIGAMELVVSRGLGATGIPLRVACPPEAVLIRLKAARSPEPPP